MYGIRIQLVCRRSAFSTEFTRRDDNGLTFLHAVYFYERCQHAGRILLDGDGDWDNISVIRINAYICLYSNLCLYIRIQAWHVSCASGSPLCWYGVYHANTFTFLMQIELNNDTISFRNIIAPPLPFLVAVSLLTDDAHVGVRLRLHGLSRHLAQLCCAVRRTNALLPVWLMLFVLHMVDVCALLMFVVYVCHLSGFVACDCWARLAFKMLTSICALHRSSVISHILRTLYNKKMRFIHYSGNYTFLFKPVISQNI